MPQAVQFGGQAAQAGAAWVRRQDGADAVVSQKDTFTPASAAAVPDGGLPILSTEGVHGLLAREALAERKALLQ